MFILKFISFILKYRLIFLWLEKIQKYKTKIQMFKMSYISQLYIKPPVHNVNTECISVI